MVPVNKEVILLALAGLHLEVMEFINRRMVVNRGLFYRVQVMINHKFLILILIMYGLCKLLLQMVMYLQRPIMS